MIKAALQNLLGRIQAPAEAHLHIEARDGRLYLRLTAKPSAGSATLSYAQDFDGELISSEAILALLEWLRHVASAR